MIKLNINVVLISAETPTIGIVPGSCCPAAEGSNITLECITNDTYVGKFQLYKTLLQSSVVVDTKTDSDPSKLFTLTNVSSADDGAYHCKLYYGVSNDYGPSSSTMDSTTHVTFEGRFDVLSLLFCCIIHMSTFPIFIITCQLFL